MKFDILKDFFTHLTNLIDDQINSDFMENIKKMLENSEFDSIDDINLYLNKYIIYSNSKNSFIEKLGKYDYEDPSKSICEIFHCLKNFYTDDLENFSSSIVKGALEINLIIGELYDLYFHKYTSTDTIRKELEDEIKSKFALSTRIV